MSRGPTPLLASRRRAATLMSLAIGIGFLGGSLSWAPLAWAGGPESVRTDLRSTHGTPIRIIQILETTRAKEGAVRAVQLWEIAGSRRFVLRADVSRRESEAEYTIRASGMKGAVVFSISAREPDLTNEDRRAGTGILKIGDERLFLRPEDASAQTVRARLQPALEKAIGVDSLAALRSAAEEVGRCGLRLAKGKLLPILAPDAYGRPEGPCNAAFVNSAADAGDRGFETAFLSIDPSVRDFLALEPRTSSGVSE